MLFGRRVPGGGGNDGGLECLESLAGVCNPPARTGPFEIRVMVEHILHRLHGHTVSCTVLGIAMRAPELVAGGKQPVAVAGTRNAAGVQPRPLQVSEALQALAFDPAWCTERHIGDCP